MSRSDNACGARRVLECAAHGVVGYDGHTSSVNTRALQVLAVLTKDIFAPLAARPLEVEVAVTVFDGKVVYRNR